MVVASCWDGNYRHVLRRQEEMGSVPVVDSDGVLVDNFRLANTDIRLYSRFFGIYSRLYAKCAAMERRGKLVINAVFSVLIVLFYAAMKISPGDSWRD